MVIVVVIVGVCTSLAIGFLVAGAVGAHMRRQAAAERNTTVRAAVDAVLAVAADRLDQRASAASTELDVRSDAIHRQVADMAGQLQRVGDLVTALQRERAEQHGQLVAGLGEAARSTAELAETAQNLRQALASPKARGQWGERMAEDVLRLAGFVEGVNYRKQTAIPGGTVPDFTFILPHDRVLHMDVKFPVDNYLRVLSAGSDAERDSFRTTFLRDVRTRIKELAGRGYASADTTVGYLLLFIPNEAVYGYIHEHDAEVLDAALRQKVVLCSPCTLFAVLAVVRQAVDNFALERASDEILQALSRFGMQWQKFSDHVDLVGTRLVSAQRAYDELAGPRRRQLERQLDALDALRVQRGLVGSVDAAAIDPLEPVDPDDSGHLIEGVTAGDIRRLRDVSAR